MGRQTLIGEMSSKLAEQQVVWQAFLLGRMERHREYLDSAFYCFADRMDWRIYSLSRSGSVHSHPADPGFRLPNSSFCDGTKDSLAGISWSADASRSRRSLQPRELGTISLPCQLAGTFCDIDRSRTAADFRVALILFTVS